MLIKGSIHLKRPSNKVKFLDLSKNNLLAGSNLVLIHLPTYMTKFYYAPSYNTMCSTFILQDCYKVEIISID